MVLARKERNEMKSLWEMVLVRKEKKWIKMKSRWEMVLAKYESKCHWEWQIRGVCKAPMGYGQIISVDVYHMTDMHHDYLTLHRNSRIS